MASMGETVRELRRARGWNQGELATRAGIALNTVSRIELGTRTPSATTVEKLAAALGVNPGILFSREQREPRPETVTDLLVRPGATTRHLAQPPEVISETFKETNLEEALRMGEEIMAEWEAIKEYLTCLVDTGYDPADRGLKNLGAQARLRHIAAAAAFTARVQELIGEDVVPRGTLVLELSPETLENIRKLAAAGAP